MQLHDSLCAYGREERDETRIRARRAARGAVDRVAHDRVMRPALGVDPEPRSALPALKLGLKPNVVARHSRAALAFRPMPRRIELT